MWKKYIDQNWYKEDKEIYTEELQFCCKKLNCKAEELHIKFTDEDIEILDVINNTCESSKVFKFNGVEVLFLSHEGGAVGLFTKQENIDKLC